ncbi:hypothetical protein EW026_g8011 [Hermanssonia centrifuga]|uniref:Transposase n=1 Tax=Hermanssonia centrifuga TaxID=98765 RepID=A0A4S4KAA6_9APHY|nr:hypothetical protein EW026_g8011 [Hermanssonia centrifuga]
MNKEYEKIRATPCADGCQLEIVVAAIMLWSDSTHLAQFGNASLWPIYAFFGNQSKYVRGKPTEFAAQHMAYIPSLPDTIQDWYQETFGKTATAAVLTQCKRELMHAIWELLLDDEFMYAYEHGIVIEFADGISRRVFPRIFSYSADYPEKVLLATIRYLATCPCPRCLVRKTDIVAMGTKTDMKRREKNARVDDKERRRVINMTRTWIYEKGLPLTSKYLDQVLTSRSWVPVRNAFSTKLSKFGMDFHSMLTVDLLHEFELGVWKAVFTHLMRILYAAGGDKIQMLNTRYRMVPTFGRGTIRRFVKNTSAMKKLAARDWEDMLQVAIPVFEGLLDADQSHNRLVLDLLFELARWHALAKLRMHTDSTFEVCSAFVTRELPREEAARGRRKAATKVTASGGTQRKSKGKARATKSTETEFGTATVIEGSSGGPHIKAFSLSTYKLHALGDYPNMVHSFGTTDNYSTQWAN